MKTRIFLPLVLFVSALAAFSAPAQAEHHRATRLGNPATRFAPALYSPADLRARFADQQLRPDFAEILRQWGWPGNLDDLFAAGLTNEISEWEISVGDTMPFMASREDGRPVCLRNVTWAGAEPVHAYAFTFHSNGRVWRCVTPKPCSNFFLDDLGPAPKAGLAIDCDVPEKVKVGRMVEVRLNVHNTGNVPEPLATVALPVPDAAVVTATTDGGVVTNHSVVWTIANLPPAATRKVRAVLKALKPATLKFNSTVSSASAPPVQGSCETVVVGIPAILLEKSDDPDPVSIGSNTTYTVKITNQGTGDDSNVQVVVTIAPELVPVSSAQGAIEGQTVTLPVVPTLAARQAVSYQIVAKGVSAGDGHTKFTLSSDMLERPIYAEESTTVY